MVAKGYANGGRDTLPVALRDHHSIRATRVIAPNVECAHQHIPYELA